MTVNVSLHLGRALYDFAGLHSPSERPLDYICCFSETREQLVPDRGSVRSGGVSAML